MTVVELCCSSEHRTTACRSTYVQACSRAECRRAVRAALFQTDRFAVLHTLDHQPQTHRHSALAQIQTTFAKQMVVACSRLRPHVPVAQQQSTAHIPGRVGVACCGPIASRHRAACSSALYLCAWHRLIEQTDPETPDQTGSEGIDRSIDLRARHVTKDYPTLRAVTQRAPSCRCHRRGIASRPVSGEKPSVSHGNPWKHSHGMGGRRWRSRSSR
jgi:hypothetical protein